MFRYDYQHHYILQPKSIEAVGRSSAEGEARSVHTTLVESDHVPQADPNPTVVGAQGLLHYIIIIFYFIYFTFKISI